MANVKAAANQKAFFIWRIVFISFFFFSCSMQDSLFYQSQSQRIAFMTTICNVGCTAKSVYTINLLGRIAYTLEQEEEEEVIFTRLVKAGSIRMHMHTRGPDTDKRRKKRNALQIICAAFFLLYIFTFYILCMHVHRKHEP